MLKGRVTEKIQQKQTCHWGTHLDHHLLGNRKDLAMPAEVKEVSVWWNGSICSVPSLIFLPISFFLPAENCNPPQLCILLLSWWMKEASIASPPCLLLLFSAVSLCAWGRDVIIFIKCLCVLIWVHVHGCACVHMHRQAYKGDNLWLHYEERLSPWGKMLHTLVSVLPWFIRETLNLTMQHLTIWGAEHNHEWTETPNRKL